MTCAHRFIPVFPQASQSILCLPLPILAVSQQSLISLPQISHKFCQLTLQLRAQLLLCGPQELLSMDCDVRHRHSVVLNLSTQGLKYKQTCK